MTEKENNVVFIFDFDGVIVNSVKALYTTYIEFLADFGIAGNKEEFDFLNGPKLAQIITYFQEKYKLALSHENLLKKYQEKLAVIYDKIELNEGLEDTLKHLKNSDFTIALASAAKRNQILSVLEKYKLQHFFNFIISGDEVKEAKPSPEIYNAVKTKFPEKKYFVIEDSDNGIQAALSANTHVIFYNDEKRKSSKNYHYEISSFAEIHKVLLEVNEQCYTVAKASEIHLNINNQNTHISIDQEKEINAIWNKALEKKKLVNNTIVCYLSHQKEGEKLIIEGYLTEYKFFFAQFNQPSLKLNICPIGVSGVITDDNQNTLLAVRKNVTEYNDFYETIPSGSIDAQKIKQGKVDFKEQLTDEFEEETQLAKELIKNIEPLCLLLDDNHGVYDICGKIHVKGDLHQLLKSNNNNEYKNISIKKLQELKTNKSNEKFVPTSCVLLNHID